MSHQETPLHPHIATFTPAADPAGGRSTGWDPARRNAISRALEACSERIAAELTCQADGAGALPDACRTALASFAEEARQADVPPERVLTLVKGMVRALAAYRGRSLKARDELMARLVLAAIEGYYLGPAAEK